MKAKLFLEIYGAQADKKYSSKEWSRIIGVTIFDPDGWDRQNDFESDFEKEISLEEFLKKAAISTTNSSELYIELLKKLNV